jgi:ketosteroid isomerase-like protein
MTPSTPQEYATLVSRIERLEARAEIRELVARYCFAVDERDVDGIGDCFTRGGAFRSYDGKMDATGRAAVIEQFHGRFAVLGPSNHFTHDQVVTFDESDSGSAKGLVNAHAEVVRNGRPLLASLRYHDEYRREEGRWRFEVRTLAFFYYVEPQRYQEVMLGTLRNEAYPAPHPADFPEALSTWQRYYREHPRG